MKNKFLPFIITLSAVIIAIGEMAAAVDQVKSSYIEVYRAVSNEYDYNQLKKLHVGLNDQYVEAYLSKPLVVKQIETELGDITVKHYLQDKYWLTLYVKQQKIVAYTILTLLENFTPGIFGSEKRLLDTRLTELNFTPEESIAISARTGSAFIDQIILGREGLYKNGYLGYVEGGAKPEQLGENWNEKLVELVHMQERGEEDSDGKVAHAIREGTWLNLYGSGDLSLGDVSKGLLSTLELTTYQETN